jgi:hypothetical protein
MTPVPVKQVHEAEIWKLPPGLQPSWQIRRCRYAIISAAGALLLPPDADPARTREFRNAALGCGSMHPISGHRVKWYPPAMG